MKTPLTENPPPLYQHHRGEFYRVVTGGQLHGFEEDKGPGLDGTLCMCYRRADLPEEIATVYVTPLDRFFANVSPTDPKKRFEPVTPEEFERVFGPGTANSQPKEALKRGSS